MLEIAKEFGRSLDSDEFDATAKILSDKCAYHIGEEVLKGPEDICSSYEGNMLKGRAKFDKLVWGKARIESLGANQYFVHFTDYLGHAGTEFTYRCKQRLTIENGLVIRIEHIEDPEEQSRFNRWKKSVGLT